ncbi:MAG: SAM-dependent methyltransferase [Thaumarchaeota archaeon]|nr:SAM-dependent methyltransferase [Nitrososphaerota archaeon]
MKIEEYLKSLPGGIVSGEDVTLPEKPLREMLKLAELGSEDVFYHLGCNNEVGVSMALQEFNVKKAVGIDKNCQKIEDAKKNIKKCDRPGMFLCEDVIESDISDATVVLFWFTNEDIIHAMMKKFQNLTHGAKVLTVWGPLPECLPSKVKFPYVLNKVPFKKASSLKEQLLAVFGVKCVDFVTAWEFAERYTKSITSSQVQNDRFLTIIQTLMIWINAKNLGVACEDDVPESIKTYISIMREHFNIDFGHLLKE